MEKSDLESINNGAARIEDMAELTPYDARALAEQKLIDPRQGGSREIKAFRELRTRLIQHNEGRNFSCLVVGVDSGASTHVVANLGAAFALDKTKTSVLIDCNLYQTGLARYMLAGSDSAGLTDFLDSHSVSCEEVIYATCIPRMRVVPVGKNSEGGTEKFASSRMAEFLSEVKARYQDRFVLVDAPSFAQHEAEVRILSNVCDFMLIVVPYGKVSESQLQSMIASFPSDKIVGVVFNEYYA